ncbi:MAG: Glu-tRNA(Gln) amidotransferase subunit GatE [Candidatus Methanodesulfokora sp.]
MKGLKVGLEIHQRLKTHKLFCNCPSMLMEREPDGWVMRMMGISRSELGSVDPAARFELLRQRKFLYGIYFDETCEVEVDESPPLEMNREAIEIAIRIAKMLNMDIVDEIHTMRKIVVDGSNTTGFQRTALIAIGGEDSVIRTNQGEVRIATLCLEEESAFIAETGSDFVRYKLDRLGIPLVEIATHPDIKSPEQAKEVALRIGRILRATGKVMRGIGTIRQDINVSIEGGARQEIKGVQEPDLIPVVISREVDRQLNLLRIRDEISERGIVEEDIGGFFELSDVLKKAEKGFVRKAIDSGESAFAIYARRMRGLIGREIQPGRRLGTELASYAKVFAGVKGIIHSDELPNYGISSDLVAEIRNRLGIGEEDAFILVISDRKTAEIALKSVADRLKYAIKGIPEETRRALEDGNTEFMRPMPGSARMYPETDVLPVLSYSFLEALEGWKPEFPEDIIGRLISYGISRDQAEEIFDEEKVELFERVSSLCKNLSKGFVASTLTSMMKYLRREGVKVELIPESKLAEVLLLVDQGALAKEAVESMIRDLAESPYADVKEIAKRYSMSQEELEKLIDDVVSSHRDELMKIGEKAFSMLMGEVMKKARGRVDGRIVSSKLRERIRKEVSQEAL